MNFHFHLNISLADENFDKRKANIVSSLIDSKQNSCNSICSTIFGTSGNNSFSEDVSSISIDKADPYD